MEIERLRAFLRTHRRVALDTCIFIYQWQANPLYVPLSDCIFSALEQSDFAAVTSTVTMAELLVHPYKQGPVEAGNMFGLLSTYPNLEWIAPNLETAAYAAKLRAQHGLRTPDSIQAATAMRAKATAMLTNDPVFKRIADLDVLVLDDYV